MYDRCCMLVMNRDPSRYSTDYWVYMGSSMIVRPLASCHCTCALINWTVLSQLYPPQKSRPVQLSFPSPPVHPTMDTDTGASMGGCRSSKISPVAKSRGRVGSCRSSESPPTRQPPLSVGGRMGAIPRQGAVGHSQHLGMELPLPDLANTWAGSRRP